MKCSKCGGPVHKNGHRSSDRVQKYKCSICKSEAQPIEGDPEIRQALEPVPQKTNGYAELKPQGGISIDEFLEENDVSTRVDKVLRNMPKNKLFTIDEIQEATGFRRGFPQLRTTIDAHREYYGKGVADGRLFFGHPDVIAELKRQKVMS